ncbi:hypothetical protein C5167_045560 [Papaver somniferum]|uniref:Uncharacterized protein n=1 Tax=Papaver somniferum TaxID=3469 RepID=A0A4Y7LBB4_PAPSO|nr:hypothetical protein C5167_045560 [Papaver somniferum]
MMKKKLKLIEEIMAAEEIVKNNTDRTSRSTVEVCHTWVARNDGVDVSRSKFTKFHVLDIHNSIGLVLISYSSVVQLRSRGSNEWILIMPHFCNMQAFHQLN